MTAPEEASEINIADLPETWEESQGGGLQRAREGELVVPEPGAILGTGPVPREAVKEEPAVNKAEARSRIAEVRASRSERPVDPPVGPSKVGRTAVKALRQGDATPVIPSLMPYNRAAAIERGRGADPRLYSFDRTQHGTRNHR